jgi:carboxyl-terminal processing protease
MPGSPAEKAGLKGGDIVTKVDDKEITKSTSLSEVISWIKGPKGTTVNLTVTRGEETFIVPVIREKIVLSNIEEEKINHSTYYVKIKTFGENVSGDFKKSLENIKSEKNIKKIIIDLRNNG